MAQVWLKGAALSPSVTIPAGGTALYADAEKILARNGWSVTALTRMGVTHVSLHTADPGTTGANEVAEARLALTTALDGDNDLAVDGDQETAVVTAGAVCTHIGLWGTE